MENSIAGSKSFSFSPSPSLSPSPEIPTPTHNNQSGGLGQLDSLHQSPQDEAAMSPPPRPPRKLKSDVWNHFEKIVVNGEPKAKCLHCNNLFSGNSKNGTSHLKDHLDLRCTKRHMKVDIRQRLLSVNRSGNSTIRLDYHMFSQ